jgi:hypothetical protein
MLIPSIKSILDLGGASRKLNGRLKQLRRGRFVGAFDFYVPYRCFNVHVKNGGGAATYQMAVDSVSGNLDLWRLDLDTTRSDCLLLNTDRYATEELTEERAVEILIDKTKRELFRKGFFRVKELNVTPTLIESFYMPYWVGLYSRNELVRLDVVNGLTGNLEGVKVRDVVTDWFRNGSK